MNDGYNKMHQCMKVSECLSKDLITLHMFVVWKYNVILRPQTSKNFLEDIKWMVCENEWMFVSVPYHTWNTQFKILH